MNLQNEKELFLALAPKLLELVNRDLSKNVISKNKGHITDVSTQIDIACEDLIVAEIKKQFPKDHILAEEGYSGTEITDERLWVIDPICGTTNLSRGMEIFCSNIALSVDGDVVASCVVDHCSKTFYWSIGKGIYKERTKFEPTKLGAGLLIDVDFGSIVRISENAKDGYLDALKLLAARDDTILSSLNTSLSNLYVAAGRIDAMVCGFTNPWDIAASAFLVEQAGGCVTDMSGGQYSLKSKTYILAGSKEVHQVILEAIKKVKL